MTRNDWWPWKKPSSAAGREKFGGETCAWEAGAGFEMEGVGEGGQVCPPYGVEIFAVTGNRQVCWGGCGGRVGGKRGGGVVIADEWRCELMGC